LRYSTHAHLRRDARREMRNDDPLNVIVVGATITRLAETSAPSRAGFRIFRVEWSNKQISDEKESASPGFPDEFAGEEKIEKLLDKIVPPLRLAQ